MTISFSEAVGGPVPATEIEINLQGAGGLPSGDQIRSILVVAEKVTAGEASANEVNATAFADADAAQDFFGAGSPGDCMCQQIFAYRNSDSGPAKCQVYGAAVDENDAGTAAEQDLTFATNADSGGVWIFKVGGHQFSVAVSSGDTPTEQAAATAAAFNALTWAERPPITAASALGVVTFTANVKGASINNVALETVQDPDISTTATWESTTMGGGAPGTPGAGAGPSLTTVISNMASFQGAGQIVSPWLEAGNTAAKAWDSTAVNALVAHAIDMAAADSMVPTSVILAHKDSAATLASVLTTEVDDGDDAERVSFAAAPYSALGGSGTWDAEIAAQFAAMRSSEQHLARSLDGLKFVDIDAPAAADNWTRAEMKTIIEAGGSPVWQPEVGAQMVMVRNVSARTEFGVLDGTVMDTLDYVRAAVASKLTTLGRASIIDDDEDVPPVEHITQPKSIKALIRTAFDELAEIGYLTNIDDNWDSVIVELVGSTLSMSLPTDVVPQLHNKKIRLDATV